MKRTTYFILAEAIIGFAVIIGTLLYELEKQKVTEKKLSGKQITSNMPHYRHIKFRMEGGEPSDNIYCSSFLVIENTPGDSCTLSYPEELKLALSSKVERDTLFLHLDKLRIHALNNQNENVNWEKYPIKIQVTDDLRSVHSLQRNDLLGAWIIMKQLKGDSLNIQSFFNTCLDSCEYRIVQVPEAKYISFKNCKMEHLYLDLDKVGQWTVEKSNIHTQHLSGSNHCYLSKDDCKQIKWTPKKEGAKLYLELQSEAFVTQLNTDQ